MESRSTRRQRSPEPDQGTGTDRVSALPDDLLLLVLACLSCASTAAGTSLISRRWRDLWTGLRKLVFRDVAFPLIEAVLSHISPGVSLLDIRIPGQHTEAVPTEEQQANNTASVSSLLRAAARLDPKELVFSIPSGLLSILTSNSINLPSFRHATSIMIQSGSFLGLHPTGTESDEHYFPLLQTLALAGCTVTDLDALFLHCPRLRSLTLSTPGIFFREEHMKVHSVLLQELVVRVAINWGNHVEIIAPELKEFTMSIFSADEANIHVLAPKVEKLWWVCAYPSETIGFALWCLEKLMLQTGQREGQPSSLKIHACNVSLHFPPELANFVREIKKHMVASFSVLEIRLRTMGHSFGALLSLILGMQEIRTTVKKLKVVLWRSTEQETCDTDCACEPTEWTTQAISLTALEKVKISGFKGDNHEFGFLQLIIKSAPMLKALTVVPAPEISSTNDVRAKISNILGMLSSSLEFLG